MTLVVRRDEILRRRGRAHATYTAYLAARLDKRALLRRAWGMARDGARRFGGTSGLYLAAALRQSWAEAKARIATARGMAEDRFALTVTGLLVLREAQAAEPDPGHGDQLELALA